MRKISTHLLPVLLVFSITFCALPSYSQSICVLEDDFNRADNTTVGNGWTEVEVAPSGIRILSNQLQMGETVNGTEFLYKDFYTVYPTVFRSSPGTLTWAFNMKGRTSNPTGFGNGQYGMAFILGCTSSNPATGNGYAVALGNAGAPHQIRLVRFNGGIANQITFLATPTGYGAEAISIRVVYVPTTDNWSLYLESAPVLYPQSDPRNTATLIGTASESTFTGEDLRYMGPFFNHGFSVVDKCNYDEICRPQLTINSITTGAVTGAPFNLIDCLTTAAGTVNFSATGTFNAGNIYTAQLSDASGSFSSPVNIGTVTSSANTGTINITIPAGTPSGTQYRIRVISSDPSTVGSVSTVINIVQNGCVSAVFDYFRSRISGNWETPATWESSHNNITWFTATMPPSLASPSFVHIQTGHTVTLNSFVSTNKLTVESGAMLILTDNLEISNSSTTPDDMTIFGTINATGSGMLTVVSPANIRFKPGSVYDHQRNGGEIPAPVFWDAGSTCRVTGITTTAPDKLDGHYSNFYWNCPGQSISVTPFLNPVGSGADFHTSDILTIANTGTGAFSISKNQSIDNSHLVGSIRVMNNGLLRFSEEVDGNTTGIVTIDVGGDVIVDAGGKLDFGVGQATPGTGYYRSYLNIEGNLFVSPTGSFTCSDNINYGAVRFTKAGTQTVNLGSGAIINRLDYNVIAGSTTVMLNDIPVYSFSAGDFNILTVESNAVIDAGANARVSGNGYFELFGTLKSANSDGISSAGSLPVTNVLIDPASTVEYNSVSPQAFTGRLDYANVAISGGGMKTLDGHVEMSGQLFLNAGRVQLGDYYLTLTLAADAIPVYSGNSYIVTNGLGGLERSIKAGSNSYVFPTGNSANIQEFTLNFASPVTSNFLAARFIQGNGGSNGLPLIESGHTISQTSGSGYWEVIAESPLTQNYTGTFSAKGFTDILNYANLHLLKRSDAASPWTLQGTHVPTSGSNSLAVLSRTGFSGFSQFAVGGQFGAILPVTILNFNGYKDGINNQFTWTTAEEVNNKGFEVQRSTDGINFQVIAFVSSLAPGGNSSTLLDYHFTDKNPGKLNQYYRLKQVDINGQNKFSNTVLISSDMASVVSINSIYPVPAKTSVNLVIESPCREEIRLVVTDIAGRMMMQKSATIDEGYNSMSLDISRLAPGNYLVKLVGSRNNELATGKFLKF